MNTIENNKLIAEFMGEKLPYLNEKGNWEFMVKDAGLISSPNIENLNKFLGFNYDNDWNCLMEVVEKILSISLELDSMEMYYNITDSIPRIDHAYKDVIDFIKWYNEQKSA